MGEEQQLPHVQCFMVATRSRLGYFDISMVTVTLSEEQHYAQGCSTSWILLFSLFLTLCLAIISPFSFRLLCCIKPTQRYIIFMFHDSRKSVFLLENLTFEPPTVLLHIKLTNPPPHPAVRAVNLFSQGTFSQAVNLERAVAIIKTRLIHNSRLLEFS